MKRKRFWKTALLLAVPLTLLAIAIECNSWRPKTMMLPRDILLNALRFSPDGHALAAAVWVKDQSGSHTDVLLYDVATRRMVKRFKDAALPCFLGHGESIAIYGANSRKPDSERQVTVFAVPDGKVLSVSPRFFLPVGVLPDGRTMIGWMRKTTDSGQLFRWDTSAHPASKTSFSLYALASADFDAHSYWMLADRATVVGEYAETKNARQLTLHFWDAATRNLRFRVQEHSGLILNYAGSPGGLFAFYNGDAVEVWDCKAGTRKNSFPLAFPGQPAPATGWYQQQHSALALNGAVLAGVDINNTGIGLWDINTGKALRFWPSRQHHVNALAFSPDGRTLASGAVDGTIKLRRIK